ncbi:MAG: hypothetical protein NDJ19_13415, partial [Ramlibacter sp.]|nr:hypothetical protein [Ramlibacter sp.]
GTVTLLAALVRDGKADEARQLLARLREQYPDFDYRRGLAVLAGSGERYLAVRANLVAALSEIGLQ